MARFPMPARPSPDEGDVSRVPGSDTPTIDPMSDSQRMVGRPAALPARERAPLDAAATHPDFTESDGASDADLERQIEALKAFLARYPSSDRTDNRAADRGPAGDTIPFAPEARALDSSAAAAPASPSPESAGAVPEAHVDSTVADTPAQSSSPGEPASEVFEVDPPADAVGMRTILSDYPDEARSEPRVGLLGTRRRKIIAVVSLAMVAALAISGLLLRRSAIGATTGALSVETSPGGVPVFVDGASRGLTPLKIDLPTGDHLVEIVTGSSRRAIPVSITPGGQVSHFFELAPAISDLGELLVRTDVPGVSVLVDGRAVGRSPLTVRDLTPGVHSVVLQHESGSVTERVVVEAGRTASLVASIGRPRDATAAGWISITVPADVQVYENGRLLGSSRVERIMLPIGRHELELVNEALGFRQSQAVQVSAGAVSRITPRWPQGSLALNAIPWAEVWIDGRLVGETPIGSLAVPVGVHEVLFRHPELGERRATVTVRAGEPTKIGVDLGAK